MFQEESWYYFGISYVWINKNNDLVNNDLNKLSEHSNAESAATSDFLTLYTKITQGKGNKHLEKSFTGIYPNELESKKKITWT